jgi:hypothetical protein
VLWRSRPRLSTFLGFEPPYPGKPSPAIFEAYGAWRRLMAEMQPAHCRWQLSWGRPCLLQLGRDGIAIWQVSFLLSAFSSLFFRL